MRDFSNGSSKDISATAEYSCVHEPNQILITFRYEWFVYVHHKCFDTAPTGG